MRSYKRPDDCQLSGVSDIVAGKQCKPDSATVEAETTVKRECDVCIPRSMFHSCSIIRDVYLHINSK